MGVLLQGTPRLSISCKQASEFFQWKLRELRSPREQPHHQHTQEGDHEGQPKGQVANCQQAESNLSLPVGGGVNSGGVDQTTVHSTTPISSLDEKPPAHSRDLS